MGARTVAIDASKANIEIAKHHGAHDPSLSQNLTYKVTSAESLLSESERYDVVCSMEVVEHVDNPIQFLSTCADLVKVRHKIFCNSITLTKISISQALRTSLPLHNGPNTSLLLPNHLHGRKSLGQSLRRNPYSFKIHQPH